MSTGDTVSINHCQFHFKVDILELLWLLDNNVHISGNILNSFTILYYDEMRIFY